MGYVPHGQTPPPDLPPQSYLASDVGKPGVPKLSKDEMRALREIEREHPSKYLRVAWVGRGGTVTGMIVFDAFDGPCETWPAGYHVINGACNEYYEPGENPYYTHGVMGCYPSSTP